MNDKTADPVTCDFCAAEQAPEPTKIYIRDAAFFTAELNDGRLFVDEPEWLACCHCADLIDSGRWVNLVSRCTFGVLGHNHIPPTHLIIDQVEETIRHLLTVIFGQKFVDGYSAQKERMGL